MRNPGKFLWLRKCTSTCGIKGSNCMKIRHPLVHLTCRTTHFCVTALPVLWWSTTWCLRTTWLCPSWRRRTRLALRERAKPDRLCGRERSLTSTAAEHPKQLEYIHQSKSFREALYIRLTLAFQYKNQASCKGLSLFWPPPPSFTKCGDIHPFFTC